jgi:hypothetical protein
LFPPHIQYKAQSVCRKPPVLLSYSHQLTGGLIGYSPGSVSLGDTPPGSPMLLQIHDAAIGSSTP